MGKDSLRRTCACMVVAAAATLLHGCAVVTAPGFDFADPKTRTSITLGQYVPSDADAPPAGMVTPISPALVQAQQQARPRGVPSDVATLFGEPTPYTIGPSDVIGVLVYDHPELATVPNAAVTQTGDPTGITSAAGFMVSSDGQISFPYIGRVKVAGLTDIEASELFKRLLAKYIRDPQVTVRVQSFRSRRVYVDGEVRTPGIQIVTDAPMTLPEALSRAGGFTANADRSVVTVTRNDQTSFINFIQLQELGINPNRILLQNGDMVTVRNRDESKVYVMGEVERPSALIMKNGRMTLNEALGEAGGPRLTTANTAQIYVIRNSRDPTSAPGTPLIYHLNAASPTALALADTFQLRPRDVLYIDPVPLVQWNRIVSLILPSVGIANTGTQLLDRVGF